MIIDIRDDIPDEIALQLVLSVVKQGKISHDIKGNEYYCWVTGFNCFGSVYNVITRKNSNQPSFIVCKEKEE